MIIDTNNLSGVIQIKSAFTAVRKAALSLQIDKNDSLVLFEPKEVNVIKYYTDAEFLMKRICKLTGFKIGVMRQKANNDISKPIVWSIMASFGHTNSEICRAFQMSSHTGGMTNYYREKLKEIMKTHPSAVYLYTKIIEALEKDIEVFEEELDDFGKENKSENT